MTLVYYSAIIPKVLGHLGSCRIFSIHRISGIRKSWQAMHGTGLNNANISYVVIQHQTIILDMEGLYIAYEKRYRDPMLRSAPTMGITSQSLDTADASLGPASMHKRAAHVTVQNGA